MSLDNETQNEWQACPPGEVKRLADRLHDRRQSVAGQRKAVGGVLLLLTLFTGYYFIGVLPHAEPNYGGIVCSDLYGLMPQYMANKLDAATTARIHKHLSQCDGCQRLMDEMATGSMRQSALGSAKPQTKMAASARSRDANASRPSPIEGFASLGR